MHPILSRLFKFVGYKVIDIKVSTRDNIVTVILERSPDKLGKCWKCGCFLGRKRGSHPRLVEHLPVMGMTTFIEFKQYKGHCTHCGKARNEHVGFLSKDSKKFTKLYVDWLSQMCEFACISRVAKYWDQTKSTIRDMDFNVLKRLIAEYKIPEVTHISVDEVYAFNTPLKKHQSRNDRFYTVISDLNTHKVIWVSEGRSKEALDHFYTLLGKKNCKKIQVVAMDQFDRYKLSTEENCPNAAVVWDRFHIMKSLEEAINEERKKLHNDLENDDPLVRLTRGSKRFIFLKKASRRSLKEQKLIDQVCADNGKFLQLEVIKEYMFDFFNEPTIDDAKDHLDTAIEMAWGTDFDHLKNWFHNLSLGWETLKNYFTFRVTSALSEGVNNVIKTLKRSAYGYRDPVYFAYKIMQRCGYLNSDHIQPSAAGKK